MDNPTPPPPPQSSSPQTPPSAHKQTSSRQRPPLIRNSTTGSSSPLKRQDSVSGISNNTRVRTQSADVVPSNTNGGNGNDGAPPSRGMMHYRSASSARFRDANVGSYGGIMDPLLMVSLERPDLEDEAETTLLDVLERRHVHFGSDAYSAAIPAHRRTRTFGGAIPDATTTFTSPNIETTRRPNSAPDSTDGSRTRPGLISRSSSYRLRRHRNHLTESWNNLGDYLGVEGNGISLSHEENPDLAKSSSSDGGNPPEAYQASGSPTRRPNKYSNWNSNNHNFFRRQPTSSFNRRRTSSETAEYSESSSIRERAFQVAMAMKNDSLNTFASSEEEGGFSDLLNRVEAVRENDDSSRGSVSRKTGGSKDRLYDTSPRDNWSRSTKSQERDLSIGGSSGFSSGRRGHSREPFMGISTPLGGAFGGQSNVDMLFHVAEHIQDLCQIPEEDEQDEIASGPKIVESIRSSAGSIRSQVLASENANFLQQISASHPEVPELPDEADGVANEQTPMLEQSQTRQTLAMKLNLAAIRDQSGSGKPKAFQLWIGNTRKHLKLLWAAFDFAFVKDQIWSFVQYQVSCVIVPMLAVAAFFFYRLGNPTLPFLPNDTSVSWWILFAIRSYLTLQLAHMTEYLFVDVLATRSPVTVRMVGPLVTMYIMNAKGWPFLLTCWGIWNFVLVHGDSDFYEHWFYSADIEMLNPANRADGIVDSEVYTDILLSMIMAGVATSIKRTILALYLGKRVYIHYKPKLEKVMIDMLLLTEVAELANALDEMEGEEVDSPHPKIVHHNSSQLLTNKSTMVEFVQAHQNANSENLNDSELSQDHDRPEPIKSWNRLRSMSNSDIEDNENVSTSADKALESAKKLSVGSDLAANASIGSNLSEKGSELCGIGIDDENVEEVKQYDNFFGEASAAASNQNHVRDETEAFPHPFDGSEPPVDTVNEPVRNILHQTSTTSQIRSHLDRWTEPVNKLDKSADPTIHEILQFRKALAFLDDEYPFGMSFGPAFNRDSCINSSRLLYKRLLGFDTSSPVLHFDVIGVLAYDASNNFDEKKAKGLVRLFRPDRFDEVTLLAFVQSCDSVYKRLRYLRASVGNSTSIDRVLESIFNSIFNFFLFLAVLSVMKLNPWALLVSMSTVLVSFAFALGPTAAKFIEGMVMIAVRRPFDLGDRISISNPNDKSGDDDPGFDDMWLVEDCNLFTTTLRLARSNEISYLNNGMLSNCKIVNHGRSVNATVNIMLHLRLEAAHKQIELVKSALDQYIRDNPRVWTSLVFWRTAKVDPNMDKLSYALRVQHVKSWQDHASVMRDKGDLLKFCSEILMKLGIHYDAPPTLNDIFVKELPPHSPYVADHMAQHD